MNATEAVRLQLEYAHRVSRVNEVAANPIFIAGVDISVNRLENRATGAIVVLNYPELRPVEVKTATGKIEFPYIPGLLSFREIPLLLEACEKLVITPDLFLVDGQGIAHPRRMGIASHLGLFLDRPTIGCAKSRLYGKHKTPGLEAGSYTELLDNDEVIGAVVRTKTGTSPVYVSIGHKVDLPTAVQWVLACCRKYRLPEPTRLAHLAAGGNLNTSVTATLEKV